MGPGPGPGPGPLRRDAVDLGPLLLAVHTPGEGEASRCSYIVPVCRPSAGQNTACGYYLVSFNAGVCPELVLQSRPNTSRVEANRVQILNSPKSKPPDHPSSSTLSEMSSLFLPSLRIYCSRPELCTVCNVRIPRHGADQIRVDTYFPCARLTDAMAHHSCRHSRSSRPNFSKDRRHTHITSHHTIQPGLGSNKAANRRRIHLTQASASRS